MKFFGRFFGRSPASVREKLERELADLNKRLEAVKYKADPKLRARREEVDKLLAVPKIEEENRSAHKPK